MFQCEDGMKAYNEATKADEGFKPSDYKGFGVQQGIDREEKLKKDVKRLEKLIEGVMKYCKSEKSDMNAPLWGVVGETFSITYDEAESLCKELGEDPKHIVLADPDFCLG